jgi:hypothetical protein
MRLFWASGFVCCDATCARPIVWLDRGRVDHVGLGWCDEHRPHVGGPYVPITITGPEWSHWIAWPRRVDTVVGMERAARRERVT